MKNLINYLGLWKLVAFLALYVIGWFALPVILLFISRSKESLPRVFRWFDNFSGPEEDGLAGDLDYRVKNGFRYYQVNLHPLVLKLSASWLRTYWRRYVWLAWRNPCDYAKGVLFGIEVTDLHPVTAYDVKFFVSVPDCPFDAVGRPLIGNDNRFPGYLLGYCTSMVTNKLLAKELYYLSLPYTLFGKEFITRIRVGYKTGAGDLNYRSSHRKMSERVFLRWEFSAWPLSKANYRKWTEA